jgi:hypothetical protein
MLGHGPSVLKRDERRLLGIASTSPRTRSQAPRDTGYEGNPENDPDDHVKWSISAVAPWVRHCPPHDKFSSGPVAAVLTLTTALWVGNLVRGELGLARDCRDVSTRG